MSAATQTFEDLAALASVPDDAELILPPATVSGMTGLSTRTLERQRHERKGIPYIRVSANRSGYLIGDVRAFIRKRRVETKGGGRAA